MATQGGLGRHLIHEAHDELDWAEAELKRVQEQLAEEDREHARRLSGLSALSGPDRETLMSEVSAQRRARAETLGLCHLYLLQSRAAQRFARLARVYEIACTSLSPAAAREQLARFLFRADDNPDRLPGAAAALERLAAALSRYFNGGLNDATDQSIRDAWMELDGVFTKLGRKG
jgi:hypothetical protein